MDNKFEKIKIGFLVLAVLFLGVMLIFQQRAINQIRSQILAIGDVSLEKKANSASVNLGPPHISQEEIESQKAFEGEIKSAVADNLEVEAELYKLKDSSKLERNNSKGITLADLDKFKKMIKVSLNEKTQYFNLKKEDLKVGAKIFVTADNSPFKADSLTALKIAPY